MTNETLGVVEIFYGKHERFLVFDFGPRSQLVLSASPQFGFGLPPASTVIYRVINLTTNRERQGMVEGRKRKDPSEEPHSIAVSIIGD